jgi:dnd system-associated protein 4
VKNIIPPDWLFLDKSIKEDKLYDKLTDKNSKISPFAGKQDWEVFIVAMSLGFKEDLRKPLDSRVKTIPLSTIRNNDEVMWLIKSIAIAEKGTDVLMDPNEMFKIAEEYANGGIRELYEKVFNVKLGDPELRLEDEALKILGKNNMC